MSQADSPEAGLELRECVTDNVLNMYKGALTRELTEQKMDQTVAKLVG